MSDRFVLANLKGGGISVLCSTIWLLLGLNFIWLKESQWKGIVVSDTFLYNLKGGGRSV